MDTILYLYKRKNLQKPLVEAIRQKTYLLIKIGMDVEPYRWFMQILPRKRSRSEFLPQKETRPTGWGRISPGYFRERKEIRHRTREWKKYESLMDTLMARCRRNVESQLAEMMREISHCAQEGDDCRCVYDREVRDVLCGDGPVAEIWRGIWTMEEFTDFTGLQWAQLLIPHAAGPHFVVLGEAACIPEILRQCADRMKSLRWIVDAAYGEAHEEELEEFAENFYQEQGLAITLEQVRGRRAFGGLRTDCREAVNILDFTEDNDIACRWAAEGSIWLDMGSSEEKCRRIAGRNTGIRYFSLRETWRQVQKKSYRLDTMVKNEYNT